MIDQILSGVIVAVLVGALTSFWRFSKKLIETMDKIDTLELFVKTEIKDLKDKYDILPCTTPDLRERRNNLTMMVGGNDCQAATKKRPRRK